MRLLIAEDEPVSRSVLIDMVESWGYQAQAVSDGLEAYHLLLEPDAPQLVLVDWVMPGLSGVQLCRRMRRHMAGRHMYFILLTVKESPEDIVQGLTAGANDYITKPFNPRELRVRLMVARRTLSLQQELLASQTMLRHQATCDPLTGLWNRQMTLDELSRQLARSRRDGVDVAALLIDIDRFKQINDTLGHLAGDAVLSRVAEILSGCLRESDRLGRYGGDEFLLTCAPSTEGEARALAGRMRQAVAETPIAVNEAEIHLTISVGVALGRAAPAEGDALIDAADRALYQAKRAGRNRVAVAPLLKCGST